MKKPKSERKFEKAKITILELLEEGYMGFTCSIFLKYIPDNRLMKDAVEWLLEQEYIKKLPKHTPDNFVITKQGLDRLETIRRDRMYKVQTEIAEKQAKFNKFIYMATGILALTTAYELLRQMNIRTELDPVGSTIIVIIGSIAGVGAILLVITFAIHLLNDFTTTFYGSKLIAIKEKKK